MQPAVTFLDPESAGHARRKIYRYPLDAPNGDFVQVRLDRDAYVDSRKISRADLGWQPDCEAREVLARCQHAGFLRCVFRGCTLESFYSSLEPEYISLLVPTDVVEDTVEALREVEMDGSTQKLASLAERLKMPLDAWLAPGERSFRRGADYTIRSSRFLQLLRLLAGDYHVRVKGRAEEGSVRVEVRPECVFRTDLGTHSGLTWAPIPG